MRQQGLFKTIYKGGSAPMCSIAGMIDLAGSQIPGLAHKLKVMNELQAHRGPDGNGIWMREAQMWALPTAVSASLISHPASSP